MNMKKKLNKQIKLDFSLSHEEKENQIFKQKEKKKKVFAENTAKKYGKKLNY